MFSIESLTITLISIGLAMDTMAFSLGIGTAGEIASRRGKIRLAAHFGIFQSGMTALGWLAGETVVRYVEGFDHWIAFVLLGETFGKRMEIIGGMILIGIGIRVVITHLLH